MLNKIILSQIKSQSSDQSNNHVSAMLNDVFEEPATYKSWVYPLRYLLALRYLKQKQRVLAWFREQKIYPILDEDFSSALLEQLSGDKEYSLKTAHYKSPITSFCFKEKLVYPAMLAALIFGGLSLNDWLEDRRIDNVLANHLPFYTDLLHRKLLLSHNNGTTEMLEQTETSITKEQEKILSDLPEKDGIRELMNEQLNKLKDSATDSESIMLGFKAVNTLFDQKGLPYYLSPKSFSIPCSSFIEAPVEEMMMLKQLESLMSNDNPERCRTTMMTVYKVSKRNQLFYDETSAPTKKEKTELPLFHVKRIDKVPAVDNALGLTFKDRGIGSIILTDRIENFSRESILPALTFQGRSYVIPYWMQGYYEIEEAVTKGYKKDLNNIYPKKVERLQVKTAIKKLIKDKARLQNSKLQQSLSRTNTNDNTSLFGNSFDAISVLLGNQEKGNNKNQKKTLENLTLNQRDTDLLDKLDKVLVPSIEYHEAYHQIDKKEWIEPAWVKTTFKGAKLTDNGLEHTMEELGAYLSQIASTNEGHNIWLSKLLIFSLNPLTKGQAEYYASSIILTTFESIYSDNVVSPYFVASVENKNKIYKKLIGMSNSQKRLLAEKAFQILFKREVPKLSRRRSF